MTAAELAAYTDSLERELFIGPHAFPYGMEPDDLIAQVRVEMERAHGHSNPGMLPLAERLAAAEAEARRRWPYWFPVC